MNKLQYIQEQLLDAKLRAAPVEADGKRYYFGCNVLGKLLAQLRDNGGKLDYKLPDDLHLFGKPII